MVIDIFISSQTAIAFPRYSLRHCPFIFIENLDKFRAV